MARSCSTVKWGKIAFDVFLILSVVVFVACTVVGVIPAQRQGFYCDDNSLKHKYYGDTISFGLLILASCGIPIFMLVLVEVWQHTFDGCTHLQRGKGVGPCVRKLARVVFDFIVGLLFAGFMVEVLKVSVGELRPHFLYTCQPNLSAVICSQGYITNYTCTSTLPLYKVTDAHKSFPSGHAALSMYACVFMILYVHARVSDSWSRLLRPIFHVTFLVWALYCSMSRITDKRHHWWDVLVGGCIGGLAGYTTVMLLCEWFRETPTEDATNDDGDDEAVKAGAAVRSDNRTSQRRLLNSTSSDNREMETSISNKNPASIINNAQVN